MISRFAYQTTGRFASGAQFETELLVVASSEEEAEDEAITCLESFESLIDWSIRPCSFEPADDSEVSTYQERGAFTVFDPAALPQGG